MNLSANTNTLPVLPGLKVTVVNNLYKVEKKKEDLNDFRKIIFSARKVIRKTILDRECCVIQRLVAFTEYGKQLREGMTVRAAK